MIFKILTAYFNNLHSKLVLNSLTSHVYKFLINFYKPFSLFSRSFFLWISLSVSSTIVFAQENLNDSFISYDTLFSSTNNALPIFKFTNNKGKVTYSTSMPKDFIEAKEVPLAQPPLNKNIEETKKINKTLKAAADDLSQAREKREALREAQEIKRLEKLRLVNSSKPPVVYQQDRYVTYPYYRRAKGHQKHNGNKPVHLPAHVYPKPYGGVHGSNFSNSGGTPHHP